MFLQVAEVFTNNPGKLVPIDQTISGFKEILEGKYDHLPEVAFYMVGNIDEVSHIPLVLDMEQQPVGSAFISWTIKNDEAYWLQTLILLGIAITNTILWCHRKIEN